MAVSSGTRCSGVRVVATTYICHCLISSQGLAPASNATIRRVERLLATVPDGQISSRAGVFRERFDAILAEEVCDGDISAGWAIELFEQGHTLAAHVVVPNSAERRGAGLLFVHGLGSSQSHYITRAETVAAEAGVVCLAFDLGGHGASGGVLRQFSPREHLADLIVAFDYLVALGNVDEDRIDSAASYGGYLAALLVGEGSETSAVARRPPTPTTTERADRTMVRAQSGRPSTLAFERLRAFAGDVLVVESELDTVIPRSLIDRYTASTPRAQRAVIHGAGHALEPKFKRSSR